MTNQQFLDQFSVKADKISALASISYDPTELSIIATEAQELLVVTGYGSRSNPLKEGFEETEKRIQDFGELVENILLVPAPYDPNKNMDNGVFVTLPNTLITNNPTDYSNVFWFTIYERIICNEIDSCTSKEKLLKIKEVNHAEHDFIMDDPFNKPDNNYAWRMRFNSRQHELITANGLSVKKYHCRYIRKPKPIDLTGPATDTVSELSDHKHRELVNKTVELYLRNIQAVERLQTHIKQEE